MNAVILAGHAQSNPTGSLILGIVVVVVALVVVYAIAKRIGRK